MTDYDPDVAAVALIRQGWPKDIAYAMADRAADVDSPEPMRFVCELCGAGMAGVIRVTEPAPTHKPPEGKRIKLRYGHCPNTGGAVVSNPARMDQRARSSRRRVAS
jgi:hypothetical protein